MHKLRIVGISGKTGSGKDSVADYLCREHGFIQIAMADPLKRLCSTVFEFTNAQLWGPSESRNKTDIRYQTSEDSNWQAALTRLEAAASEWLTEVTGKPVENKVYNALIHWFFDLRDNHAPLSPRVALQTLGTEFGRKDIHPDVWLDYMLTQATAVLYEDGGTAGVAYDPHKGITSQLRKRLVKGVVVSDVRFENELTGLKDRGGSLIKVLRPEYDELATSVGIQNHLSESSEFDSDSFDFILMNDKSKKDLFDAIDEYMIIFNAR